MKTSSGILAYRFNPELEVLLGHPGGPFPTHNWGIPKGEVETNESLFKAAIREFEEETGYRPHGDFIDLGPLKTTNKTNHIWAVEYDCDFKDFHSNTFSLEFPPHSGISREFPELDRVAWFTIHEAKIKIFKSQAEFLTRLEFLLRG